MKRPNALGNALRNSGAAVAGEPAPQPMPSPITNAPPSQSAAAATRRGTKAITVHFPEDVRRQLKSLAAEEGRSMEDMVAEALNLLFARHRKPELAPRKINN